MTRGHVALSGTFGYELDITKISEEERQMIPQQIELYHKYNNLVREGDYYRYASYRENYNYDCYGVVSKDKSEALVTYVQVKNCPNIHSRKIYIHGLDDSKLYKVEGFENTFHGDTLRNAGLTVKNMWGDNQSKLIYITECCEK